MGEPFPDTDDFGIICSRCNFINSNFSFCHDMLFYQLYSFIILSFKIIFTLFSKIFCFLPLNYWLNLQQFEVTAIMEVIFQVTGRKFVIYWKVGLNKKPLCEKKNCYKQTISPFILEFSTQHFYTIFNSHSCFFLNCFQSRVQNGINKNSYGN